RMTQVVGTAGEQRSGLSRAECRGARLMEDAEVSPVVEDAATGAGEDTPAGTSAVPGDVVGQQCDQFGVQGHGTYLAGGSVLEFTALSGEAIVGPVGAAARLGIGEDHLAPAVRWEAGEVVAAQVDDFLRAKCGVVHAAEEGNHA